MHVGQVEKGATNRLAGIYAALLSNRLLRSRQFGHTSRDMSVACCYLAEAGVLVYVSKLLGCRRLLEEAGLLLR
jgi:hypothetical protein